MQLGMTQMKHFKEVLFLEERSLKRKEQAYKIK